MTSREPTEPSPPRPSDDGAETDGAVRALSVDTVHARIRQAILLGEFAPGTEMSQVQLANELGVSRTPLREALRLLQREGLITAERNRMVRVSPLSLDDLEQLYALRIVNEALGIRLTVPQLTEQELARLDELLATMERLAADGDVERWEAPHREFHMLLVAGAGARPCRLIEELAQHSERYRRVYVTQEPRAWSYGAAEHVAIVDACRARDAVAAAEQLARHLSRTALTVIMLVSPEREPTLVRAAVRAVVCGGEPAIPLPGTGA